MLLICKLASAGCLVSVPGTSFAVHLERDPTKGADMTHRTQTEASFSQRAVGTRTLPPRRCFHAHWLIPPQFTARPAAIRWYLRATGSAHLESDLTREQMVPKPLQLNKTCRENDFNPDLELKYESRPGHWKTPTTGLCRNNSEFIRYRLTRTWVNDSRRQIGQ